MQLLVGRPLDELFPPRARTTGEVLLRLDGARFVPKRAPTGWQSAQDVSLTVRAGGETYVYAQSDVVGASFYSRIAQGETLDFELRAAAKDRAYVAPRLTLGRDAQRGFAHDPVADARGDVAQLVLQLREVERDTIVVGCRHPRNEKGPAMPAPPQ